MRHVQVILAITLGLVCSTSHAQTMVRATPLLSVGDALAGSTVTTLNPVFTDGNGQPRMDCSICKQLTPLVRKRVSRYYALSCVRCLPTASKATSVLSRR